MNNVLPSLRHLTCSRIVISLLNHHEVHKDFRVKKHEAVRRQIKESITLLIPCARLQEKIEKFIDPLLSEIENWLNIFESCWYGYDSVMLAVLDSIPHCWLSDGTIDREKSAEILVKSTKMGPINRFIFACTYCFYYDVLELWNMLFKIEKAYLRHKSTAIVRLWIEWLESDAVRDRESFFSWTLGTPVWHSNVFIMKHALQTLCPAERSQYLLKALVGEKISPDILSFCISVLTKEEQEQIIKSSPIEVFRCMLSWPLRTIFFDTLKVLWPYLTEQFFCDTLLMILLQIKQHERDHMDLIIILQNFWDLSPPSFQAVAKGNSSLAKPLQFILDFDISQEFSKRKFKESFYEDLTQYLPEPVNLSFHHRLTAARRRYMNLL